MKIFISWSEARSHHIAKALHGWLPHVIQCVKPFMSSQDIEKGSRGLGAVAENLEECDMGIVCLTPENRDARWILFESGALSKKTMTSYVFTYLYKLKNDEVALPLSQFQHTQTDHDDTWSMVKTINGQLGELKLDVGFLKEQFEMWWPQLLEQIESVPPIDEEVPVELSQQEMIKELFAELRRNERMKTYVSGTLWRTLTEASAKASPGISQDIHDALVRINAGDCKAATLPKFVKSFLFQADLADIDMEGTLSLTTKGHTDLEFSPWNF